MLLATKLDRMVTFLKGLLSLQSLEPFAYVVLPDHVTNYKYYISTTTIPMPFKLGKVVIYHEELALIKLLDPSITWFCKLT